MKASFSMLKSKTFWGAVIHAVARVVMAEPHDRPMVGVQGVGEVLAAAGIRSALAKNGTGQ